MPVAATDIQSKYSLKPNVYQVSDDYHDRISGYQMLLSEARLAFDFNSIDAVSIKEHSLFIQNHLNQASIDKIYDEFGDVSNVKIPSARAIEFVQEIITPEIDCAIKSYFKSEYAVLWLNWSVVENEDTDVTTANKWHCDSAPTTHLKTITYFDDTKVHGSSTLVGDIDSTQRLKEVGYLLNDIKTRQCDISDLLEFYDIPLEVESPNFAAGDTLLFNPTKRMHCIKRPVKGMTRHCLTLCYIPSPISWRVLLENDFPLWQGGRSFDGVPSQILRIHEKVQASLQSNSMSGPMTSSVTEENIIELDETANITSKASLRHHLNEIFTDQAFAQKLFDNIVGDGSVAINFTLDSLVKKLKCSFKQDLNWNGFFAKDDLDHLHSLIEFEKQYLDAFTRYQKVGKPEPNAVMWPNPAHDKYPLSRFDCRPYVKTHKIMDISTPVASAGSCFAFEISKVMQEQGFNYLIEERPDDVNLGVFVDGYKAGDPYVNFSANYGILFNTPSLLQLAQKAFGQREFNKYCCKMQSGVYMDPYRENVLFASKAAYLNDYPKHLKAVRSVLTNAKVLIFTAGLNECWQLRDGTVISRNPRAGFYHLLKHRVLSVEENVDALKGFVQLVRKYNPEFRLVISLSPVPLLATGRADSHHIIEANLHSKSVLKVAIDKVVSEVDGIYYLPSYELVKECSRDPWTADDRHVTRDTVERVVEQFRDIFVNE